MVNLSRILVDDIIVTDLETDPVLQPSLPHMDLKKLLPQPHPLPDLQVVLSPALPLTQYNLQHFNSLNFQPSSNIQKFLANVCPDETDPNHINPTPPPGWCPLQVPAIIPGHSQPPPLSLPHILKSLESSEISPSTSFIHKTLASICTHRTDRNLVSPTPPLEWCPLQGFPQIEPDDSLSQQGINVGIHIYPSTRSLISTHL